MSNNFWSGFGGITSLAAGAISKAKEQIRDITAESMGEAQANDVDFLKAQIERLESRCYEYKNTLQERETEFFEYRTKFDQMIEENKQRLRYIDDLKEDNKEIVKFRIVIGAEDSVEALELLSVRQQELEQEKKLRVEEKVKLMEILVLKENELNDVKKKNEDQAEKIVSYETTLQRLSESESKFKKETESLAPKNALLTEEVNSLKDILKNQNETLGSLQDSLLASKKSLHKTVEECYKALKLSGGYIGLTIPNIRQESLGIEDIQEFLISQSEYMKETITRVATSLSLKTKGTTSKKIIFKHTLEGIREGIFLFLDEIQNKLRETQDISKTTEELYHKALKEKMDTERTLEELTMLLKQKDESLIFLTGEIDKDKADFALIDTLRESNEALSKELKDLQSNKAEIEKQLENEKEAIKMLNEAYKTLESHFSSLIQKQKVLSSELEEKEKQFKASQENTEKLKQKIIEMEDYSNKRIIDFDEQANKRISDIQSKYSADIDELNQKHSKSSLEAQIVLAKSQDECKDLKKAKAQIEKYEEAVGRLQELLSSLEKQTETYSEKIDELNQELETCQTNLCHKSSKTKNYKLKVREMEIYVQEQREEFKTEKLELEKQIQHTQQMKSEAEALVNQVQKQIQDTDNMIDRRLITTFLLNYLNEQNSDKIRYQMLKALAGMLELDSEQKTKIGIVQDDGLLAQFASFISKG